ncbi:MAG: alkaline phosphatase [Candidatus Aminicenantes bacterium]|nr:MAG: alkaline phosphatase [Candidatus Aminicenantes bacterium]
MSLKRVVNQIIRLVFIFCFFVPQLSAGQKAKNIILMVPDGMGLANVTAARIFKYGIGKERLALETLKEIGYQSTHSRNSLVTDSAAAASAWACGQKFNNGEISQHGETGESPQTILELAKAKGKNTGLVATATITHATPAAFAAHVKNRACENEVARQYILETQVDVLLGGGKARFKSEKKDKCGAGGDLIAAARDKKYTVVYTRDDMLKVQNAKKLLGLFSEGPLAPTPKRENDDTLKTNEPSLAEMTKTALKILEKNKKGFFLLVEGSQVDWANHSHNLEYLIKEVIEFDKAIRVVLDWVNVNPVRKAETLIIIVPDHDTGGFAITGPYGSTITEPGQLVKDGWATGGHTAVDTMTWSQGPYSQYLGRALDNTDVFYIMKAALNGSRYIPSNN